MRGVAHLGVLDELAHAGVTIRGLAGTSSGALLGALWLCSGGEAAIARVHEFARSGLALEAPDLGATPRGIVAHLRAMRAQLTVVHMLYGRARLSYQEFARRVEFFLPDIQIEALPVPFVVVATDSDTGEEVRLDSGPLVRAVAASSGMPGLVAPIRWGDRRLQDGGAVAEIPVAAARALGAPVVAIEVSEALPVGDPNGDRGGKAMFRAAAMGWQELRRRILAEADAVIAPDVNHVHWADVGAMGEAVEAGRAAARAFLAGVPR